MRRIVAFMILAAALNSCGAGKGGASPAGGGQPPSLSPAFPPESVDHVVTYAWSRWTGPKMSNRITVYRHQNLVREDQWLIGSRRKGERERTSHYSNLATGSSLALSPVEDGRHSITIWQARAADPTHQRAPTGQYRRIAGERCEVWRAIPVGGRGVEHRACITGDGIILSDAALYRSGDTMEEQTAIKVERRRIRPEEALPPRYALSWAYWVDRSRQYLGDGEGSPNHDVRLSGGWGGSIRERTNGGWKLVERDGGEDGLTSISHSSRAISLTAGDRILSISVQPPVASPAAAFPAKRAIDRNGEKLLGEQCSWFDVLPGVSDAGRHDCQTRDGIALIVEETSWGSHSQFKATSLSRGRTTVAEMAPPQGLLSWKRWGWPELEP